MLQKPRLLVLPEDGQEHHDQRRFDRTDAPKEPPAVSRVHQGAYDGIQEELRQHPDQRDPGQLLRCLPESLLQGGDDRHLVQPVGQATQE
ncbi:MAG: hypothetical protein M5U26_04645 [Planctomycetota bacterium]|nr:hypothetical protein [Planctomycetota bacterium]